jgi:hypothetical protein
MTRALLLTACSFLFACSPSRSPEAGSQTHFLKACDGSCPSPYSCLCGVCSLPCSSAATCSAQGDGALCQPAADSCMLSGNMCDVSCSADRDCRMLGSSFECEAGRCRRAASSAEGGTGGGGAGGMSGAAASGTSAGATGAAGTSGSSADACAEEARTTAEFLMSNTSCTQDWDCAIVGSCSSGWGFESVAVGARARAQALSDATRCGVIDGPLYRAYCDNGRCAKDATGAQCGQFGGSDDDRICNGSDDVRLATRTQGGLVSQEYFFTNPHGTSYLVVDGQCRFYAMSLTDGAIRTGTLSEADAALLANDINFAGLAAWNGMQSGLGSDCGTSDVLRPGAVVECICNCAADAPVGLRSAVRGAASWTARVAMQGAPFEGSVRAMAQEIPGQPQRTPVAWPLSQPMQEIVGLIEGGASTEMSGVRFDMAEAATLHALREGRPVSQPAYVRDGATGTVYMLYVRDELPDAIETAFDGLVSMLPP